MNDTEVDDLLEKVKINIEVVDESEQDTLKPKPLGRYKLGKELDDINLRNFAHEES